MDVSVVVPAYNEEKMLGECLRSLRTQTVPCEIIVCDNDSTDGTPRIARKYADRVVTEKRRGAMFALNTGIRSAKGDMIAITGADCIVPSNWIENFLMAFHDPGMVACYGPVNSLEGRHSRYFSVMNYAERVCIRLGLWFVIQGANFMTRKKAMEDAGYFDTGVELFEENGLFRELKSMGRIRFLAGNPIKASSRRMEESGKLKLIWLGIREMTKLTLLNRTGGKGFGAVR